MAVARTVWFSFHLGCHRSAVSLSALNVSPLTQTIAPMWGSDPCFRSPTCWGQVQSYYYSCFSPKFICPTEVCTVQYILFHWSGTPVCSQLMFLMHFCVWRHIPDVSMKTDALHIHLIFYHLLLPLLLFFLLDSTAMIIPLCLPDHLSTSLLHLFYSWFLYWIFQYNTIQLFYCLFLFVLYLLGLC